MGKRSNHKSRGVREQRRQIAALTAKKTLSKEQQARIREITEARHGEMLSHVEGAEIFEMMGMEVVWHTPEERFRNEHPELFETP